jgi:hypothetical protein
MSGNPDDLLARLNALKPTNISLGHDLPAINARGTKPQSREDKLAERLKLLRSGSTLGASTTQLSEASSDPASQLISQVRDDLSSKEDPIRHWQNPDDEPSVEQLLAELEADSTDWKLNPEDPKHVQSLLKEARESLPFEAETLSQPTPEQGLSDLRAGFEAIDQERQGQDDEEAEAKQEDDEADAYVESILAELELEKKDGGGDGQEPPSPESERRVQSSSNLLDLPSPPQATTQPSRGSPPSYEDSELEARFSQLALNLPSTPTAKPSATKPKVTASIAKKSASAKSSLPTYTDEDIDSWCCICNEDGELKCLGCDGDLYCHACWRDGHGDGPGQERGHKVVQYNRRPPVAAAA